MTSLNDVLLAMSNIPVDDPIAEIWGRGLQGGHEIIEYTGPLPITITADGTALIDYKIYGNTVQAGTPTPENPVDVVGCGERTENLFDFNANNPDNGYAYGKQIMLDGSVDTFPQANVSEYISITPFSLYTFTYGSQYNDVYAALYNAKREFVRSIRYNVQKEITFHSHKDENYLRFTYLRSKEDTVMLNSGSTALPYEPYGYKLPLTSAGQGVDIYLRKVRTTRRIKKLVLTGEENIQYNAQNKHFYFMLNDAGIDSLYTLYCSHFQKLSDNQELGIIMTNSGAQIRIYDTNVTWQSASDFKQFLAAQYAAGTPVTVWYVLAEPETGKVNEPLMKIGDYADTLSMEQADVSIPTIAGTTVIDYDGTPKPSMYIKYRGR